MRGVKMSNEIVREKLNDFLETRGVKNRWVAEKLGLSATTVSYFRRSMRDLRPDKLQLLWNLINQ